nr:hypothetical protein [Clostridia bacterium]
MLENEFILKLNEKLESSERIFYFKSISINEKLGIIEINFLINYQIYNEVLTNELKNKVEKIVKELISNCLIPGDIAEIKVVYSKTNSDTKNIINKIIVYMQENHKNIQPFFLGEDKYK